MLTAVASASGAAVILAVGAASELWQRCSFAEGLGQVRLWLRVLYAKGFESQ